MNWLEKHNKESRERMADYSGCKPTLDANSAALYKKDCNT